MYSYTKLAIRMLLISDNIVGTNRTLNLLRTMNDVMRLSG